MGRILTKEDEALRPHLVEYDRHNPSPKLSNAFVSYVNSIQSGLSKSELDWLHDYEYFIFNTFDGSWVERAIPGLRLERGVETQYIKQFGWDDYRSMMNKFLDYIPVDLPPNLTNYCNMPVYRLTMHNGDKFYPIDYHGDLVAWRKQISESAKRHDTTTGHFENGKFVLSNGQTVNFSDLAITSLSGREPYPSDW